jgi:hypothetical protein
MIQSIPQSGAGLLRPVRPSFSGELPEALRLAQRSGRCGIEEADHRHLLLRACREWPCSRAADERDEIATPHIEHGDTPLQPVYRSLNLPQKGREVLGADLNRS